MQKTDSQPEDLRRTIKEAEKLRHDTAVSVYDGLDVLPDMEWVVPDNAEALDKSIRKAKQQTQDPASAANALREAMMDFKSSASPGTARVLNIYSSSTDGGVPLLMGPALSPQTGRAAAAAELLVNLGGGPDTELFTSSGKKVMLEDPIATGMRVVRPAYEGVLVVAGDVLGTGILNAEQVTRVELAADGTKPLSGPYLYAANPNGKVTKETARKEAALYQQYLDSHKQSVRGPAVWRVPSSPELKGNVRRALDSALLPDTWIPVACIGEQQAAGWNFRVLCTALSRNRRVYSVCTVYENAPGSARVTTRAVSDFDVPDFSGLAGGWSASPTPAVTPEAAAALREADNTAVPAVLLGIQIVRGINYLMCCEHNGTYRMVVVHSDLGGSADITVSRVLLEARPMPAAGVHIGGWIGQPQGAIIGGNPGIQGK